MISRAASRPVVASTVNALGVRASVAGFHATAAPQASLRELEQRVKSVKNIEKITKVCSWRRACVLTMEVDENDCLDASEPRAAQHVRREGVRTGV